jgi:bifunctional DNA-binding transcriptional regulator/antitoxin component of YhaV-PrlF toxin-antitoxin module
MKDLAPLQRNYRFSLGKEMCKKYNLKAGDILQLKETPDGILLVPVKVVPKND